MPTLAMYDVLKIQDFVFNSNRTKENCGASIIVQKVFEDGFDKILNGNAFKDWKKPPFDFRMSKENPPDNEVIYIGGGNALVAYKDEKLAKETTQKLSQYVLEQTGGMLQFSVAYHGFAAEDPYQDAKIELSKKLKMNKASRSYSFPMLGIGISKLGITDGLPAVEKDGNDYLSKSAVLKRVAFKDSAEYFNEKLENSYNFEKEFDKLGQKKGENYIAIVHIDGNNMGSALDDLINDTSNIDIAVPLLREFSYKIDQTFVDVFIAIVEKLKKNQNAPDFRKKFEIKEEDKNILRIRPIVLNGDDVTFVCASKLGLSLAEHFLFELYKRSPLCMDHANEVRVSACAGVAIVKSHFPFYRAYELAEELCKSAKEKGKIIAKNSKNVGSWLDYHIVYSGVTTRLPELRDHAYKVPGLNDASPLEYTGSKGKISSARYNLLWRPWCVVGDVSEENRWKNLKKIHDDFKKNWSRSRLKTLRNTMIKSESDVKSLLEHFGSRGYNLASFNGNNEPFPSNHQTPYFDALELLDFFVELKEEGIEQ